MTPIRFLSLDDVFAIHADTIEHEGGLSGVRDAALLESAVLLPQQQFEGQYLHQGLPAMAAAYLFHIAQNHPFHDGNKRTSAMAALIFLDANGVRALPDPDALENVVMAGASSRMTKPELTAWFREQIR